MQGDECSLLKGVPMLSTVLDGTHVITAFYLFMSLLLLFARILIWTAFLNSSIYVYVCECATVCMCVFCCLLSVQRTQCPLMENLSAISSRARCCCYFLYFLLAVFEWEKNVERVGRPPALRPSELFTLRRAKRQHDKGRRRRETANCCKPDRRTDRTVYLFFFGFFAVAFPASKSFGDMFMYKKCIWIIHKILFQAINPWLPKCFMCSSICCCVPIPTYTLGLDTLATLVCFCFDLRLKICSPACNSVWHTHYYCSPNQT